MKKFIKITAIIGVVCIFLGTGMMTAGYFLGGSMRMLSDNGQHFAVMPNEERTEYISSENIHSLKIDADMAQVHVEAIEESGMYADAAETRSGRITVTYPTKADGVCVEEEDGTLLVSSPKIQWDGRQHEENTIQIMIPKDFHFQKVEIDADMAQIHADTIQADEVEFSCNMGEIQIEMLAADRMEADCDMGNVEFTLDKTENDYAFLVDNKMGNVEIDGDKLRQGDVKLNPNETIPVKLDCNMGNIIVTIQRKEI